MKGKTLLFICTGNFYRSRFAEAVFNYTAKKENLITWRAVSRGLETWRAPQGKMISPHTEARLRELNIPRNCTALDKQQIDIYDLKSADKIIALDYKEHYPMMKQAFPKYADNIEYWNVTDIDYGLPPEEGLSAIYEKVKELYAHIAYE